MREISIDRIRARELLGESEFVALSEELEAPELFEAAEIALAEHWPAYPYLAAIFARLVEQQRDGEIWSFIHRHREYLRAATPTWVLVAHTITTSYAGDRWNLRQWFDRWQDHEDVPLWVLASYAANLISSPDDTSQRRLAEVIREAPVRAIADETSWFFSIHQCVDDLREKRDAVFVARCRAVPLHPEYTPPLLDHPMVRYINGVKRRRRLTLADLEWTRPDVSPVPGLSPLAIMGSLANLAAQGTPERPFDWRTIEFVRDLLIVQATPFLAARELFPLFVSMIETPRGDARAIELRRTMKKAGPRGLPHDARVAWDRLVCERIPWFTRFKLGYF